MGAYEVILNNKGTTPPQDDGDGVVVQNQSTEQQDGKLTSVPKLKDAKTINPQVTTKLTTDPLANAGKDISLLDLYKRLNPRPNIDEKEEEKKQRRAQLAAAIGDGISALSNLFFTYKGAPNSYTGENNITAQNKVTYDKLKKERDEKYAQYLNGYMRAFQADQANADKERAWKRQLERDKKADEDSQRDYDFRVNQADQSQKNFEAQLKQQKEIVDANNKEKKEAKEAEIKAKKDVELAKINATSATKLRGGEEIISDGNNTNIRIYTSVWKYAMSRIFDKIIEDGIKPKDPSYMIGKMTDKEKEAFVKANWMKSDNAKKAMMSYSEIDPATLVSEIEEETPDQYSLGLNWGNDDDNNDGNNESEW